MKNKIVAMIMIGMLAVSMSACGGSDTPDETKTENVKNETPEEEVVVVKRDFPEGEYSDLGSGTFSVQTSGGDSADGSTPVLFAKENSVIVQIGYKAEGMDGSKLSYIYIDGMENTTEQLGERVQGSLDLQEDALSEGIHTVEVVQYDTDEPEGEIVTYKSCQYEVKLK